MVGQSLLNLIYGNPLQQFMPQPQGGQPGPQGAPPAPAGPPGAPGPQPGPQGPPAGPPMAPAQATQSPADLQRLYIQLLQRDRSADEIDRGLTNIVAAFSPPAAQASVMANMPRGTDTSAEFNNLMQLQQYGLQRQGLSQLLTPDLAKQTGMPLSELQGLAMVDPQALTKIIESQTGIGLPLDQRQYLAKAREITAAGGIPPSWADVQAQQKAHEESLTKQASDVEEFKNTANSDFSGANTKLTENQARIDQLLNNMPATMKALSIPDFATTSKGAQWIPSNTPWIGSDEPTKQQAIAIQKIEAELTGEGLSTVKNLRNKTEFNTIGEGLTAGLNVNNGPVGVQQALQDLKRKIATAHAQAYATAGKQIPLQFEGMADQRYTESTFNGQPNPYYTGATYEPGKQLSPDEIAQGRNLIAQHGRDWVVDYLHKQGYSIRGL